MVLACKVRKDIHRAIDTQGHTLEVYNLGANAVFHNFRK